ncbi:uncharacterized protein ARMOST_21943 [Armillaria ostoyae]|uniref:Uncharacterized protein n=1 Tax=Armillaria ostoyae TaxID=47428 RepID=A0A284SBK4_ARMOS|nr:uncharacterized protein ARMOST_21943 [Armillaria ostoyae]
MTSGIEPAESNNLLVVDASGQPIGPHKNERTSITCCVSTSLAVSENTLLQSLHDSQVRVSIEQGKGSIPSGQNITESVDRNPQPVTTRQWLIMQALAEIQITATSWCLRQQTPQWMSLAGLVTITKDVCWHRGSQSSNGSLYAEIVHAFFATGLPVSRCDSLAFRYFHFTTRTLFRARLGPIIKDRVSTFNVPDYHRLLHHFLQFRSCLGHIQHGPGTGVLLRQIRAAQLMLRFVRSMLSTNTANLDINLYLFLSSFLATNPLQPASPSRNYSFISTYALRLKAVTHYKSGARTPELCRMVAVIPLAAADSCP